MKNWESLTILDNFIFSKTMEMNLDLCQRLLEEILCQRIEEVRLVEREKVIENRVDSKGIRLDVYVADSKRVFDIEMQVSASRDLPRRMRYYQGLIDQDYLKRGEHYRELRESYIIFICDFDLYKCDRYKYTFRERCDEDLDIVMGDGSTKIVLNARGKIGEISTELRSFLEYVTSRRVEGEFVSRLDEAVNRVKNNEEARLEFMTYEMELREREMNGERRGRESIALKMLKKKKSLAEISELTELPLERLKELSKSLSVQA